MKPSKHALPLFIAVILCSVAAVSVSMAEELSSLRLLKSGSVEFPTASFGTMQIVPVLVDVSTGTWRGLKRVEDFPDIDGSQVEGEGKFQTEDKQDVTVNLAASISQDTLRVQADWKTDAAIRGFGRLDLVYRRSFADQMLVQADGKDVVFQAPYSSQTIKVYDQLQFIRKSDGKTVMRMLFAEQPCKVNFVIGDRKLDDEQTATIRISSDIDGMGHESIVEPSSCKWQLVFEK